MSTKTRPNFIVDPITGERITTKNTPRVKSEALRRIMVKIKELESVAEWLKEDLQPLMEEAYAAGEKELLDFWTLSISAPKFDEAIFYKTADTETIEVYEKCKSRVEKYQEQLKEVTNHKEYQKPGTVYVKFPRL